MNPEEQYKQETGLISGYLDDWGNECWFDEYVHWLETKLSNLSSENAELRAEVERLKEMLTQLGQWPIEKTLPPENNP